MNGFQSYVSKIWTIVLAASGGAVSFFLLDSIVRVIFHLVMLFVLLSLCSDLIAIGMKNLSPSDYKEQEKLLSKCSIFALYEFLINYPKAAAFLAGFIAIGCLKTL